MRVVLLNEWDTPKDGEHFKKSVELSKKWVHYWMEISREKNIKPVYDKIFTDNTGHFSNWTEFESMDDFKRMWEDESYQRFWAEFSRYGINCRWRLMRPAEFGVEW